MKYVYTIKKWEEMVYSYKVRHQIANIIYDMHNNNTQISIRMNFQSFPHCHLFTVHF